MDSTTIRQQKARGKSVRNGQPSEILDRPPPHDLDAERAVLGSILAEPSLLPTVAPILRPGDFHHGDHGRLYRHILDLSANGGTVDVVRLQGAMGTNGELADADAAMIAQLFSEHWNLTAVAHHAATVKRHAEARRLIHAATDLLQITYNGTAPAVVRERLRAVLEQIDDGRGIHYKRLTCAELDAGKYELEYLIDRTLVAGQPCIVAGGKKCLKTSLIVDMGISLAVGGFFLGKLKVNRACRVGIMTGESGLATIQETARRICYAAGRNLADIGGLIFSEDLPRFGSLEHEDALRRFIMDDELEVLVIDPAYLCLPGADAGNLFAQGDLLRGMSKVCSDTGCMMVLAHHTRKTKVDPFSPPELEDIAWAGFQEFARQWFLVGRREPYQPGTGEHRLWLSIGGSAGHTALWAADISEGTRETEGGRFWQVELMHADEARGQVEDRKAVEKQAEREERLERDKRAVANTLAKFPQGESKSIVRDTSGLYSARFNSALSALLADGVAVPVDLIKGRRKTPIDGYKLKDETPNE